MRCFIILIIVLLTTNVTVFCQYHLANEDIVKKPKDLNDDSQAIKYIVGNNDGKIVFSVDYFKNDCYETKALLIYDERNQKVEDYKDVISDNEYGLIGIKQANALKLKSVYNKPQFNNRSFCEISELHNINVKYIVNKNNYSFKLENSNNFEDDIDIMLSNAGRYLIYAPYTGDYLRDVVGDSIMTIYDFNNILKPIIKKLVCKECIKPQIANEQLFYGKKFFYFPGTDAYDWKIYRASKFNLPKSELLAEYIEILLVSPDGKYLLGKKKLHGKDVAVILDVEAKKFDYLLGRDYLQYDYFFSPTHRKFAFDTTNHLIYINYPAEFPFNSVGEDAEQKKSSKSENAAFWEKYNYSAL
jgi:hypothetical protein